MITARRDHDHYRNFFRGARRARKRKRLLKTAVDRCHEGTDREVPPLSGGRRRKQRWRSRLGSEAKSLAGDTFIRGLQTPRQENPLKTKSRNGFGPENKPTERLKVAFRRSVLRSLLGDNSRVAGIGRTDIGCRITRSRERRPFTNPPIPCLSVTAPSRNWVGIC